MTKGLDEWIKGGIIGGIVAILPIILMLQTVCMLAWSIPFVSGGASNIPANATTGRLVCDSSNSLINVLGLQGFALIALIGFVSGAILSKIIEEI